MKKASEKQCQQLIPKNPGETVSLGPPCGSLRQRVLWTLGPNILIDPHCALWHTKRFGGCVVELPLPGLWVWVYEFESQGDVHRRCTLVELLNPLWIIRAIASDFWASFWRLFFRCNFCIDCFSSFGDILTPFGLLFGSTFAVFLCFLHNFFEHEICIDFSSILGWMLVSFLMFLLMSFPFAHSPRTKPREACFWTTLQCSALKIKVVPFQKNMKFHDFPDLFRYQFWHWFLMSFGIDFGSILGAFWLHFPCFFAIGFWMNFRSHF